MTGVQTCALPISEQVNTLWDEVLRFENPHEYFVDLSKPLWDIKYNLLEEHSIE